MYCTGHVDEEKATSGGEIKSRAQDGRQAARDCDQIRGAHAVFTLEMMPPNANTRKPRGERWEKGRQHSGFNAPATVRPPGVPVAPGFFLMLNRNPMKSV